MFWAEKPLNKPISTNAVQIEVYKNIPDISDGIITRDDEGNPTGYFREGAIDLLKNRNLHCVGKTVPQVL